MKIYAIGIMLAATAYVKAESIEEAIAIAKKQQGNFIEAYDDGETFTGKDYSDPDLPEFSFSPAMTIVEVSSNADEEGYI